MQWVAFLVVCNIRIVKSSVVFSAGTDMGKPALRDPEPGTKACCAETSNASIFFSVTLHILLK